ncbi:MAG: hypothetical protein V1790_00850 [Planctomycetota bacterium]
MKGRAYKPGASFDITKRQTKSGLLFDPRFYEVSVTEYMEHIEVLAANPPAVFSMVKTDLENAALTLSAMLEIAIMQHGQNLTADRTAEINGYAEALSDGTNASYDGETYTLYGGETRANVSPALNSPVGLINASVSGPIVARTLEHSYQSCVLQGEHPKMGITTTRCMGFINENFLPQQRLVDTVEPTIGWPGLKFKQATIVESNYMPGRDGVNDPDLGNYYLAAGETFMWLNPGGEGDAAYFNLYTSTSPKFSFGFTGFKVGMDHTKCAGQILWAGNFAVKAPRLMRILFAITS